MKLTQAQANKIHQQACKLKAEHPYLRYGQAIWSILPDEVADYYHNTPQDFFYEEDEDKVGQLFFYGMTEL